MHFGANFVGQVHRQRELDPCEVVIPAYVSHRRRNR